MRTRALVTIWTHDMEGLLAFYSTLLGLQVNTYRDGYVELEGLGIRLAICARTMMGRAGRCPGSKSGEMQSIGLMLPLQSYDQVDAVYGELVARGAVSVQPPVTLSGGQRVAYFGDPEGNVHALISEWPQVAEADW